MRSLRAGVAMEGQDALYALAERVAQRLRARGETVAVAESATGGAISAALLARIVRDRHESSWAVSESGAAGPSGNRYGDPAGHSAIAVAGARAHTLTLRTQSADRRANMQAFAIAALQALLRAIDG